jgi:hypothetical protein
MPRKPIDLAPAKWIWLPSQRTVPNTTVLFRKTFSLERVPKTAPGWLSADSRYRLWVNGERVQYGPAPADPRSAEADPADLAPYLRTGLNVAALEVHYFGHGEGTWPFGKPGLIGHWQIGDLVLATDSSWMCRIDPRRQPGTAKRSFLRAYQEVVDNRYAPVDWNEPVEIAEGWKGVRLLENESHLPPLAARYHDELQDIWPVDRDSLKLYERSIPLMDEEEVPAEPRERVEVQWNLSPDDWFYFRDGDALKVHPAGQLKGDLEGELTPGVGASAIFELGEEGVGFPIIEVEADAGIQIEIITQESREAGQLWLDTHLYTWSRFICGGHGVERFEALDYEAVKWIQIHVHGEGRFSVRRVGLRRRRYPFAKPSVDCSDTQLQKVFRANVNTLYNSAQDLVVDGMGRERQQYGGDGGHQLSPVRTLLGGATLARRYLLTFGEGQTKSGVWFDSWPAYDRLARLWQRQVGASYWGPLVDHSIGFCLEHHNHWMETGELEPAAENWPRIFKFVGYLEDSAAKHGGTLPAEPEGPETVWMDHEAYRSPGEKRCALNLYAVVMLRKIAELGEALGKSAEAFTHLAQDLLTATVERYWYEGAECIVNNLDTVRTESDFRFDDRSLATTVLYGLSPTGGTEKMLDLLEERPENLGESYPANAVWRLRALAEHGREQTVIEELRTRWFGMHSVQRNHTIQEYWQDRLGGNAVQSHCAVAPLVVLQQGLLGVKPLAPGYRRFSVAPRLGNLDNVVCAFNTPFGLVQVSAKQDEAGVETEVEAPAECQWVQPP